MAMTTIPKLIAIIALLAAAGALTWFAALPAVPTAQAQTITDYDANDNGLIDISSIAQLNAIRHDLDGDGVTAAAAYDTAFPDRETSATGTMGCPAGACNGYELTAGLTFGATSTWAPIHNFNTTLDGAGNTITGLNVDITSDIDAGMFSVLGGSARIRDLGLVGADVRSNASSTRSNGILAGSTAAGAVLTNVHASGGSITLDVALAGTNVSGLVGYLRGGIYASYSTAAVTMTGVISASSYSGGLVGRCDGCTISTSYAAGAINVPGNVIGQGGLVGDVSGASSVITNSYCDTVATGPPNCIGLTTVVGIATNDFNATTTMMQNPTGYTGIYLNWNIDTDGDSLPDYPWNFGTSSQYPTLNTPAQRAAATPAPVNYDADGDNLISIFNLAQLSALRWDADGDGAPDLNPQAYSTVFAGHTVGMGCAPACVGYELTADLTFPAATTSPYNPWTPIPTYNAQFDGNGRALTDLRVEHPNPAGLFAVLGGSSAAINLDLVNPSVTTTRTGGGAGALAGEIAIGAAIVDSVAVRGGRIASAPPAGSGYAGGLAGRAQGGAHIRNSYSSAVIATTRDSFAFLGGLVGNLDAQLTNVYAYGPVIEPAGTTTNFLGGLVGLVGVAPPGVNSYCDAQASMQADCVGSTADPNAPATSTAVAKTTAELQTPTGYTGIYQGWTPGRWNFGAANEYPTLTFAADLNDLAQAGIDSPPPGGPRQAQPPQDTPYDPAADHPEIYANARYEMAATCKVQRNADGDPETSQITFNLGNYQGAVILHLAIWNGEFFMSYESQGIDLPPFERNGQQATVRVTTDPAQTRFLLDSVSPTTNLVLGYADCHTDDPGAADADAAAADAATTSTEATPPPKVYVNDRYEMTAACEVQHNADGDPDGAVISFDLGSYQDPVILHLSQWNGEYYASYESLGIDVPPFQRNGQSATVRVATNPAQTRFLLDSTSPTTNLVLGYADCHTAGE